MNHMILLIFIFDLAAISHDSIIYIHMCVSTHKHTYMCMFSVKLLNFEQNYITVLIFSCINIKQASNKFSIKPFLPTILICIIIKSVLSTYVMTLTCQKEYLMIQVMNNETKTLIHIWMGSCISPSPLKIHT